MFEPVEYAALNSRQKENSNFQKVAARLADFGYNCLRLIDDWQGADFIACHINGETFLKVQLKGRFTVERKYVGKDIFIAFLWSDACFVYPYDQILDELILRGLMDEKSTVWRKQGYRSWPQPPSWAHDLLSEYRL